MHQTPPSQMHRLLLGHMFLVRRLDNTVEDQNIGSYKCIVPYHHKRCDALVLIYNSRLYVVTPCMSPRGIRVDLIFWYQFMVCLWFPVPTSEILRIFLMGYITVYLSHAGAPRSLVRGIRTLLGTVQFSHAVTLRGKLPLWSK